MTEQIPGCAVDGCADETQGDDFFFCLGHEAHEYVNPLLKYVPQKGVVAEEIQRAIIKMVTEVYRVDVRSVPYHEKTMTRLGDRWGYTGSSPALFNSIMLVKTDDEVHIKGGWDDEWIGERVITTFPITDEDAAWIANTVNGLDWRPL